MSRAYERHGFTRLDVLRAKCARRVANHTDLGYPLHEQRTPFVRQSYRLLRRRGIDALNAWRNAKSEWQRMESTRAWYAANDERRVRHG